MPLFPFTRTCSSTSPHRALGLIRALQQGAKADSPHKLPDTTARAHTQPPTSISSTMTKRASARSVRCTSSSPPARRQPRATADLAKCQRRMPEPPSHPAAALSKAAAALTDFPLREMLSEYGFGAAAGVAASRVGAGRQPGYCAAHFPSQ